MKGERGHKIFEQQLAPAKDHSKDHGKDHRSERDPGKGQGPIGNGS